MRILSNNLFKASYLISHLSTLQVMRFQEIIDDSVSAGSIVMQVNTMTSVWLCVGSEIAVRDTGEGRLNLSHEGWSRGTGVGAIASTIWKIGI